ncbi:putative Armadillo repeat-containing protein, partial [Naja naja]
MDPAPNTELQHVGKKPLGTTFRFVPKLSMSQNQKEAGLGRLEYLQALVTEFQVTDSS